MRAEQIGTWSHGMFPPDRIYRTLPFAYIALGIIVATEMDSLLGTGSGVLLGITGLLIWKMRVDYRRELAGTHRRAE
jgi:hypothetical protein